MVRKYAVIMALIGMLVVLLRGFRDDVAFESAVTSALIWMTLLGIVGAVVGQIAEATVVESVRTRIEIEVSAARETNKARQTDVATPQTVG